MTAVSKASILSLYKNLLRESQAFPSYNFRMYALRRIKSRFRETKNISEVDSHLLYEEGIQSLKMLKRQVIISKLYNPEKLVIEMQT